MNNPAARNQIHVCAPGNLADAIIPNADGSINVQVESIVPPLGGAHIAENQVSVTSAGVLIVAARATREDVVVVNLGTTDVYLGDVSVTTSTGVLLVGIKGAAVTIATTAAVYGVVASTSQAVSFLETYS